jgi:hypothetical protein
MCLDAAGLPADSVRCMFQPTVLSGCLWLQGCLQIMFAVCFSLLSGCSWLLQGCLQMVIHVSEFLTSAGVAPVAPSQMVVEAMMDAITGGACNASSVLIHSGSDGTLLTAETRLQDSLTSSRQQRSAAPVVEQYMQMEPFCISAGGIAGSIDVALRMSDPLVAALESSAASVNICFRKQGQQQFVQRVGPIQPTMR